MEKRVFICQEILKTEESYLHTLEEVQSLFLDPLKRSAPPILTQKQIQDIFSNILDIYKVNAELYRQLCERDLTKPESCIGDIFKFLSPFLKIYSVYAKNYQLALSVISELEKKNHHFSQFLHNVMKSPECRGLSFQAYILTPIQRIPRYKLLLDDLLKHTPPDHPDYQNLVMALESIEKVAVFVNEMIREHEQVLKMLEIQKSMSGLNEDLIIPGRKLIHQGLVTKICRKTNKPRVLFLFSDCLIYAAIPRTKNTSLSASTGSIYNSSLNSSQTSSLHSSVLFNQNSAMPSSFVFHRKFLLEDMKVVNVKDNDFLINCFQVKTTEKSFGVLCPSEADKENWLRLLSTTITNYRQNKKTLKHENVEVVEEEEQEEEEIFTKAPVWVPDNATLSCMECDLPFTFLKRRHHCRLCGRVVCNDCSNQKSPIPKKTTVGEMVRVCKPCYLLISTKLKKERPSLVEELMDDSDSEDEEKEKENRFSTQSMKIKNFILNKLSETSLLSTSLPQLTSSTSSRPQTMRPNRILSIYFGKDRPPTPPLDSRNSSLMNTPEEEKGLYLTDRRSSLLDNDCEEIRQKLRSQSFNALLQRNERKSIEKRQPIFSFFDPLEPVIEIPKPVGKRESSHEDYMKPFSYMEGKRLSLSEKFNEIKKMIQKEQQQQNKMIFFSATQEEEEQEDCLEIPPCPSRPLSIHAQWDT